MPLLRPFIFISLHIPTIHRHSLSPPRGAFIRHFTAILTQEAISHKVRERELHHPLFCWHYSTVHGENLQKCLCGNPSGIIHIFSTKTALAAARWANGATTQLQRGCFYTSAVCCCLNPKLGLLLPAWIRMWLSFKNKHCSCVLKKRLLGLKMDSPWVAAGHHLEARGVAEQFVQGADDTGELGPQVSLLHPALKHQLVQHHGAIHGRG